MARRAEVSRKSGETSVDVKLEIDGSGRYEVSIPDAFTKHMVESLARYAQFDLILKAQGDIDHHIIEDSAIALGACLRKAMGETQVERVAHSFVPMDDALVLAAVDIIDRPYIDVRDMGNQDLIGEMHLHFLRSFVTESRICLHVWVLSGKEGHHVTEAVFKALGLSLRHALEPRSGGMSTKGRVDWRGL
jgi:imidazoleglycerol-phosphate dehydratase